MHQSPNLRKEKKPYAIPLVNTIMHYPRNYSLYVIVHPDFKTKDFWEDEDVFNLENDDLSEIIFFGYLEQCERQHLRFPGKIIKLEVPYD